MFNWPHPLRRNPQPTIQPHLTNEFKNLVGQEAQTIKQDVYKNGWMENWIASKTAANQHIRGYRSTDIDLGPTPEFILRGMSDREHHVGFGNARDYYTHLNFNDIQQQIINNPQLLKKLYEISDKVYNDFVNQAEAAGITLTDAVRNDFRKAGVRSALMNTYYSDKDSLMGDIQKDAIVTQSLITSVADRSTPRQHALQKFKPEYMMDMFPEGILPYTSKRVLELRSRGVSPEDIKKQIQVEENFFRARGRPVDDDNLARFNTFINACATQALADEAGLRELDIDNLKALDATYVLDPEGTNVKERAQRIMRHVKDPKTAYMWHFLEQEELERRKNWFKKHI
jgi:hypothetical protein